MKKFLQTICLTLLLLVPSVAKSQEVLTELVGGSVLFLENSGNTIYAGTYGTVFKSTDEGDTWKDLPFDEGQFSSIKVIGNEIYIGSSYGVIQHSSDNGSSWEKYNTDSLQGAGVSGFVKIGNKINKNIRKEFQNVITDGVKAANKK